MCGSATSSHFSQILQSKRIVYPSKDLFARFAVHRNLKSGPILAVLIHFLLRAPAEIGFALPAGMLFTKRIENRA